jgi:hypothetical protein
MEDYKSRSDIPPEGIETTYGHLYPLPKLSMQILFVVASFLTAILLGLTISIIPGDLSEMAKGVIYFIYLLVFILGYSSWVGLLGVLAFSSIKMPMMKMIFRYFVHKEKPASVEEILPSREKMTELLVRAQKSARIFFILSWPIGIVGGIVSLFMNTSINSTIFFVIILITAVIFGYVLFYFGRRGYLPFPEE